MTWCLVTAQEVEIPFCCLSARRFARVGTRQEMGHLPGLRKARGMGARATERDSLLDGIHCFSGFGCNARRQGRISQSKGDILAIAERPRPEVLQGTAAGRS